jgi:hypothetical protein
MMIAIREAKRPIPEKMAMAANELLSDEGISVVRDETVEAGICKEMRAALDMSGSPNA